MKTLLAATAAVALLAGASAVGAQDFQPKAAGDWVVNFRATSVAPDESGPIETAAGAPTGLSAAVSDDTIPSLGITYFVTDKVAVEVILADVDEEADTRIERWRQIDLVGRALDHMGAVGAGRIEGQHRGADVAAQLGNAAR